MAVLAPAQSACLRRATAEDASRLRRGRQVRRAARRRPALAIPCRTTRLVYRGRPLVMGIVNVTPDSFSDGGRFAGAAEAVAHGLRLEEEGADLLDVGGESTRPGAEPVPAAEERRRVLPVIARLADRVRIPISVDTSKAEVAREALEAGASLVNDVTALRGDPEMAAVVARGRAALVLMHMRGQPRTMQRAPRYRDVAGEVAAFLAQAARRAEAAGVERSRILLDPGLGFGKTVAHNLILLRSLGRLASLGYPLVLGPSRKSFIGKALNAEVGDRLAGTLACVAFAQRHGAHVVRVHDVKATVQLVKMLEAIERP
jgi:dihydropteroate synthase